MRDIIYTESYLHVIVPVAYKDALIARAWAAELCGAVEGGLRASWHKPVATGCAPDHLHVLVLMNPNYSLDQLAETIRRAGEEFINARGLMARAFAWKEHYSGFSTSREFVSELVSHISGQWTYHEEISFLQEWKALLEDSGLEWEDDGFTELE